MPARNRKLTMSTSAITTNNETDAPEAPVCLDIFAHGKLIGQVLANSYRNDLKVVSRTLKAGEPRPTQCRGPSVRRRHCI